MVSISIEYLGDLHCNAVHGPSGATLDTDAPKDNHGRGESFSPTDLVATALGSCILSVMGIVAKRMDVDLAGATATVEKEMATDPVRRISQLGVKVRVPTKLSEAHQKKLERAALSCPVHKSMHPDMRIPILFDWG